MTRYGRKRKSNRKRVGFRHKSPEIKNNNNSLLREYSYACYSRALFKAAMATSSCF